MSTTWLCGPSTRFCDLPAELREWAESDACAIFGAKFLPWYNLPLVNRCWAFKVMQDGPTNYGRTTGVTVPHKMVAEDEQGIKFFAGFDVETNTVLWGGLDATA